MTRGKYIRTKEIREKISESLKGRHISKSTEFKKGRRILGINSPCWKRGYSINKKGYKILHIDGISILESRYVWIQHNKMPVPKSFVIHHRDENKLNNDIDNLLLLPENIHNNLHTRGLEE